MYKGCENPAATLKMHVYYGCYRMHATGKWQQVITQEQIKRNVKCSVVISL